MSLSNQTRLAGYASLRAANHIASSLRHTMPLAVGLSLMRCSAKRPTSYFMQQAVPQLQIKRSSLHLHILNFDDAIGRKQKTRFSSQSRSNLIGIG